MKKDLMKVAKKLEYLGLLEEAAAIKVAIELGSGYSFCEGKGCGNRYKTELGSKTIDGKDLCPRCSGSVTDEEFRRRREVALQPFRSRRSWD